MFLGDVESPDNQFWLKGSLAPEPFWTAGFPPNLLDRQAYAVVWELSQTFVAYSLFSQM